MPSTPAQLGTLELGALLPLVDILGVDKGPAIAFALVYHTSQLLPAIAFALVYHTSQLLPTLVIGLVLEWRLVLGGQRNVSRHART